MPYALVVQLWLYVWLTEWEYIQKKTGRTKVNRRTRKIVERHPAEVEGTIHSTAETERPEVVWESWERTAEEKNTGKGHS